MPRPKAGSSNVAEKVASGIPFSEGFLEALREASLPLQMAMLRRHYNIPQLELANELHVKQAYLSRLEREGTDHLVGQYLQAAEKLKARLVLVPFGIQLTKRP